MEQLIYAAYIAELKLMNQYIKPISGELIGKTMSSYPVYLYKIKKPSIVTKV
jgi:hypothetical protein